MWKLGVTEGDVKNFKVLFGADCRMNSDGRMDSECRMNSDFISGLQSWLESRDDDMIYYLLNYGPDEATKSTCGCFRSSFYRIPG
jgi:hypothetical protein